MPYLYIAILASKVELMAYLYIAILASKVELMAELVSYDMFSTIST